MAQDIRKMMKEHKQESSGLPQGHEARFEARLNEAFAQNEKKQNSFYWLKVAAIAIVILGAGYFGYQQLSNDTIDSLADTPSNTETKSEENVNQITLGDISPDLKKIENFYLNGINVQLASLELTDDNKELIDGYMKRLAELDAEYALLNKELNEVGPTEATITALIDNLKLRLELLFKLKNKLKELKNLENEQFINMEA